MPKLNESELTLAQKQDMDIRLRCVSLAESDMTKANVIYNFVTGADVAVEPHVEPAPEPQP